MAAASRCIEPSKTDAPASLTLPPPLEEQAQTTRTDATTAAATAQVPADESNSESHLDMHCLRTPCANCAASIRVRFQARSHGFVQRMHQNRFQGKDVPTRGGRRD